MSLQEITDKIIVIDIPLSGRTGVLGTYLIEGDKTAVIDPGPTSQAFGVMDILRRRGITQLESVLLSHIHLDHGGGAWKIAEEYDSIIHCHPRGAAHIINPAMLKAGAEQLFGERVLEYGEIKGAPEERVRESKDSEVIDLGGITLEVHWTPGHSSHSQTYWEPDSKTVFVGDAVGQVIGKDGPIIPVSPPPHNPVKAVESIDMILALTPETLCIAHFGPHDNARKYLNRIKKRTTLWEELSVKAAREELSLEDLVSLVKTEDIELIELLKGQSLVDDAIKGSIQGFWMYGKWKIDREQQKS